MKSAVVIGSSRGIGFELVKKLSKTHFVLAVSRNIESLKNLDNVLPLQLDISDSTFTQELSETIQNRLKSVDILINNAGYLVNKHYDQLKISEIERIFKTNVFGLMLSCQTVIPFMKNDWGHIVNIGSMGGFQGSSKFPGLSAYSASKAAVANYSECLAEELKSTHIRVNCLALGATQTEMLAQAFPGYQADISAKKMAEYISDFSQNAHQWMNGKIIPVSNSTP